MIHQKIQSMALISIFTFAVGDAVAKDMTFDIIYMNQTNVVVADGEITADTPAVFQTFLDSKPFDGFSLLIHLNSIGGNLFGGIKLGQMIRAAGLGTDVRWYAPRPVGQDFYDPGYDEQGPGQCYSACALAFLGGKERKLSDGAIIGFHQFSGGLGGAEETQIDTQIVSGKILEYISDMGVAPSLFSRMSQVLPNDVFIPSKEELLSYSIISKDAFTGFTLEPYRNGIVASSVFPENAQGDNLVYQITTYCKKGRPFVLLSGRPDSSELYADFAQRVQPDVSGFSIWLRDSSDISYTYPANAVELRAGNQLAEIGVDRRFVELISRGRVSAAVLYPHADGGLMHLDINATKDDIDRIMSSFKLCVD